MEPRLPLATTTPFETQSEAQPPKDRGRERDAVQRLFAEIHGAFAVQSRQSLIALPHP